MLDIRFLLTAALLTVAAAAPPDVSAYAGKQPFEPVRGITLFQHPAFIKALAGSVPDASLRRAMLKPTGPSGLVEVSATSVKADGCQAHNCGDHHWTIEVDRRRPVATVCYHAADTMGTRSRWYLGGGRTEMRAGSCFGG